METVRHPVADYPVPVYDTLRRGSGCKGAGSEMLLAFSSLSIAVMSLSCWLFISFYYIHIFAFIVKYIVTHTDVQLSSHNHRQSLRKPS